jgi:hypothetical protein
MAIPTNKLKDLAFSTQFRVEHVATKSHIDYTLAPFDFQTITIPHNLGYVPFFRLWVQFPGSSNLYYQASGPGTFALVGSFQIEDIYADTTNVYVRIADYGGGSGNGKVYYRVYAEPLS